MTQLRLVPKKRLTQDQAHRLRLSLGRTMASNPEAREVVEAALDREIERVTEGARPAWGFSMASDDYLPALFDWAADRAPRSPREASKIIAAMWRSVDRRDGRIAKTNRQLSEETGVAVDDVGRCLKALAKDGFLIRIEDGRNVIYGLNPWVATRLRPADAAAAREGRPRPMLVTKDGGRIDHPDQPELIG